MGILNRSCLAGVALLLVSGCARVSTLTTIQPDGSYHRKVVYTGTGNALGGALQGLGGTGSKGSMPDLSLAKLFSIPSDGAAAVKRSKGKQGEEIITVERDFKPSIETPFLFQDIAALSDKGKPLMTSSVSVRKLPTGDIQYDETLKWSGPALPKGIGNEDEFRGMVKAALPERFRSNTGVIDHVEHAAGNAALHALMGPPYPMMFDLMANTDAAVLRLRSTIGSLLPADLARMAPELSAPEQAQTVKNVLADMDIQKFSENANAKTGFDPKSPSPGGESSMSEFSPLLFEVAFPGTVVQTNGLIDPVSGHVYWSLYPMSASFEDVDLRVVVRLSQR